MTNWDNPIPGITPTRSGDRGESWTIRRAKARFSEVFRRARTEGPQRITPKGKKGVVIISAEEYDRLVRRSHRAKNLVQFFRQSPLFGINIDLERDRNENRGI